MFRKVVVVFLFNLFVSSFALAANSHHSQTTDTDTTVESTVLSTEEVAGLLYMREEEKLARDVYLTLYEQWQNAVFSNIAESEQNHTDSILALLEKYRLLDPALQETGLFTNTDLQTLYNALIERGMSSEIEGLMVGALIEEVDMVDIQHAIDAASQEDIIQVYENLLCGSRNHLRAFVGQIEDRGIVYEAQKLSQEEVDAIVDSPVERHCGH